MINISEILSKIKPTVLGWIESYLIAYGYSRWVMLHDPLTSTSFDGDAFSDTSKTLIDLSAVFGVPAGIKAVKIRCGIADGGANSADAFVILSPNNTAGDGFVNRIRGLTNSTVYYHTWEVPCDSNGDIYYQVEATGAGTANLYLQIWGYLV